MTSLFWALVLAFFGLLALTSVPLGRYMARLFAGEPVAGSKLLGPVERLLYRAAGVDPKVEQSWKGYALSLLLFSLVTQLFSYAVMRAQKGLPGNPARLDGVAPWLSFNTAVSFATNTNWQSYSGETTMSYASQAVALASHNFFSAAAGIAVAVALIRGIARSQSPTIGNFWVDLVRAHLYLLLPLSLVYALFLVSQGVVQTWAGPAEWTTLGGETQRVVLGPVASQEAIKMLGTNGGGFFNANSAHPFENPTPLSNFVQMFSIFVIPSALCVTLGQMVKSPRHGWAVFAAMTSLAVVGVVVVAYCEQKGNPVLSRLGADPLASALQPGGNMEGKELRFGINDSALFVEVTTAASCGAVNTMHDSLTPLAGLVPLLNIQLGEIVFGGVGAGMYGMLVYVLLTVFLSGLMVGRTPEYLGKKIDSRDVRFASLYVLIPAFSILLFTALAVMTEVGRAGIASTAATDAVAPWKPHPHGLAEVLYAFSSATGNNGSAFAGLTAYSTDHPVFYSLTLGVAMFVGRFPLIVAVLAMAGNMAKKRLVPPGPGSFPVDTPLFTGLLVAVIVVVGALTFFPALALSPLVEHLLLGLADSFRNWPAMSKHPKVARSLWEPAILKSASLDALKKLDPRVMARNPVMFVVEVGSALVTLLFALELAQGRAVNAKLMVQLIVWLWFTVLFANFAEAMAEGRGKAQAATLRKMRTTTTARRVRRADGHRVDEKGEGKAAGEDVPATELRKGDVIHVKAGELIAADGEIIEGVASVDESAITGESAPVVREAGGDRSAVTGGTRVLSDWVLIEVRQDPGAGFVDKMIALVEGAERQKTPNEIALTILLAVLTLIFLVATATLEPFARFFAGSLGVASIVALLVCLIPTTIGGLLSAIGIAGMDRLVQKNVLATSGRAVEAAGDIDVLMLDKTGTITYGNRQAAAFRPVEGVTERELGEAASLASLADDTPEGKSIVALAERMGIRPRGLEGAVFVPFTARTRMSGVDGEGRVIRKGASDVVASMAEAAGKKVPDDLWGLVDAVAKEGGTPLVVIDSGRLLGVIYLKDTVKPGMRERFERLRAMGIRTVMITGDNPLTAATIAREAGVDDFLAEATPETKLAYIRTMQEGGRLVAMTGDGTNDAPALAQADVGVAMNTGTQAAKEAGNMVDLDSDPTKLIEIVEIGKQLLMTRGSLTTFSIANDVAKYFSILPAIFAGLLAFQTTKGAPATSAFWALNVMRLGSPESAILSAIIFNALIIVALIPLALRGVRYRPLGAGALLSRNLLVYGAGGVVAPFVAIKLIDLVVRLLHLA